MKQSILHTAIWIGSFLFATLSLDAQSPIKEVRAGNEAFKAGKHEKALEHYEKALDKGMKDPKLRFNKGDALYRLEKYADAARTFQRIARNTQNEELRAKAFHNKGNAHLKAGKLEKSIEAYKEALRIDPSDEDTRYNLALAKKLKEKAQKKKKNKKNKKQKKKQQKDQKQKGGKQKKQKKKKGQEKKKGKKQQKGKQNRKEQQKEGKKGQRGKEDRKKKEGKKAGKGEQQKGEKDKKRKARALSPEEVEQLLKAMEKKEGKVQQKVLRKMRKKKEKEGEGSDDEKDW